MSVGGSAAPPGDASQICGFAAIYNIEQGTARSTSEIAPVRQKKNPIKRECGDGRESREVFCPLCKRDHP